MPAFAEKYTDRQRDAMAYAYEDRRIRPAAKVVDLAKRGELEYLGERLDPFETNEESVRNYARHYRKKRLGHGTSKLAELPHADAVDALRRRLVTAAEALTGHYERTLKHRPDKADPERLRQIARAMAEIQRLDPNHENRRPSRETRDPETGKRGPRAMGGLAGTILKAHRNAERGPSVDEGTDSDAYGEQGEAQDEAPRSNEQHDGAPGSLARSQDQLVA